ncbi:uncharacterized protein LOC131255284 [Magnolia sinica]|uniref:uncharacterized protein LOC131255284 n=1 Tax=Magnolia sinica TaxID=86752 RepID=UPI002657BAF9|nr:uncharacterized protein LOC131255284 [Magnolia sinica]
MESCWSKWVSINGEATGYFESSRGLRQGDPLLPSLLIIVAEALNRGYKKLMEIGPGRPFHLKQGCPIISHLLFANDTPLFLNRGRSSIKATKIFLNSFQEASRQKINLIKSSFLCSDKVSDSKIRSIEHLLRFPRARAGFKHLGVPISKLSWMIWKKNSPTFFGAGLTAKGSTIGSARSRFASLEEGGLGIRVLKDVMKVFRLKLAWSANFRQIVSQWAALMRAKYPQDFLPAGRAGALVIASPLWKFVRELFPLLEDNIQWQIGSGDKSLWAENWTRLGSLNLLAEAQIPKAIGGLLVKALLGKDRPLPPSSTFNFLQQIVLDFIFQGGFATSDDVD